MASEPQKAFKIHTYTGQIQIDICYLQSEDRPDPARRRYLWPLADVGSTAAIGGAGDGDGVLTAFPVGDSYSVDWVIVFSSILLS